MSYDIERVRRLIKENISNLRTASILTDVDRNITMLELRFKDGSLTLYNLTEPEDN